MRRVPIEHISERLLIINLYGTQAIVLGIAWALLWWQERLSWDTIWRIESGTVWLWGIGTGVAIVVVDLLLSRLFPRFMVDDGGINEKLFRNRPLWHIFVMTAVIAICEELLFRGALQPVLGLFWTSVLFALIHFRYLTQWMMTVMVFLISIGLGMLLLTTDSLVAPVVAHFVIDFTLGVLLRFGCLNVWLDR